MGGAAGVGGRGGRGGRRCAVDHAHLPPHPHHTLTHTHPHTPHPHTPTHPGVYWAPYLVALGALMGIVTALTVGLFSAARLMMVGARDWLLPPLLSRVSPRTQTPLVAQTVLGLLIGGWVDGAGGWMGWVDGLGGVVDMHG